MTNYDFITDNIRYSYSSTSNFDNCNYAFKLTYIDKVPRGNNFFSDFGTLVHETLEKYFNGELDSFELSDCYRNSYEEVVVNPPPSGLSQLYGKYREQGQVFFDEFSFDRDAYEILVVEDSLDLEIGDALFVAKPDLVLRNKETNKNVLFDYKTSMPWRIDKRSGKEITDKKKIEGYYKQMYIYTYSLRMLKGIDISEISILFPRANRTVTISWEEEKEIEAIDWLKETIKRIQSEKTFSPDNSNSFFCNNLCSVSSYCEYKNK